MAVNVSKRSVGVNFSGSGEAEIVVWAPLADKVEIIISNEPPGRNIALEKQSFGYWKTETPKMKPGICLQQNGRIQKLSSHPE